MDKTTFKEQKICRIKVNHKIPLNVFESTFQNWICERNIDPDKYPLTLDLRITTVTSDPRALRIPANSTAMYPLPETITFLTGEIMRKGVREKREENNRQGGREGERERREGGTDGGREEGKQLIT